MKYVTARELASNAAKFLRMGEPIVVMRHGRPAKLLLPFDENMLAIDIPSVRKAIAKSLMATPRGKRGKTEKPSD